MKNGAANLKVINNDSFETHTKPNPSYYAISNALQKTLDFHKLIATFSDKISDMVAHTAYIYSNPEFNLEIKQGVLSQHSCSYAIEFENQKLGVLTLMRNYAFDAAELELLESLLCCLLFPLNNARTYNQTLKLAYGDPFQSPAHFTISESTAFDRSFSKGVNAHIEYNRRLIEKKRAVPKKQDENERSPWAVGLYR